MILNRLSNAIREQNWFTVLLEIIIVVVGIFLGLQVDDWNEQRKYRQEESVYLAKIHADLSAMKTELEDRLEGYEERITIMMRALAALESCDSSADAAADVRFAMERYQNSPPVSYLGATYNEMVASGALARLADEQLKQKIASAFGVLEAINDTVRNFRISIPVVDDIIWRNVAFSVDRETGRQIAIIDMPQICENQRVRNAVVEMIDIQHDARSSIERSLGTVNELLELLSSQNRSG